ncbi:hypothetical protein GIB67_024021 [Kingdonia uniflora]|uniref:separase n=1 Tax=Kingdonia uniflora TaxID=39325 RepID=A0A7J7NJT9_9MAGN|nr:hypothetical protein GIB67_024021 [Kingdonia uniflora]
MVSLKDIVSSAQNNVSAFILLEKDNPVKEGPGKTGLTLVADETASVHFQLWGTECDAFEPGDIIRLTNGIFSCVRNKFVLRAGKRGMTEKVGEFSMVFVLTPNMSNIQWGPNPSKTLGNLSRRMSLLPNRGIAGKVPKVEEQASALKDHDLFICIGHGNGMQYSPWYEIRKVENCAATVLMGCCSGSISYKGCYNPQGSVISYLLAGSPVMITNVWDVTSPDIDRFGRSKWSSNTKWLRFTKSRNFSLVGRGCYCIRSISALQSLVTVVIKDDAPQQRSIWSVSVAEYFRVEAAKLGLVGISLGLQKIEES